MNYNKNKKFVQWKVVLPLSMWYMNTKPLKQNNHITANTTHSFKQDSACMKMEINKNHIK